MPKMTHDRFYSACLPIASAGSLVAALYLWRLVDGSDQLSDGAALIGTSLFITISQLFEAMRIDLSPHMARSVYGRIAKILSLAAVPTTWIIALYTIYLGYVIDTDNYATSTFDPALSWPHSSPSILLYIAAMFGGFIGWKSLKLFLCAYVFDEKATTDLAPAAGLSD